MAQEIDVELMSTGGFSIDQLMELAGLSVACAVHAEYQSIQQQKPRILIVAGPGNNGGDGLVAARHLKHFGYLPLIVYPKPNNNQLFQNLLLQCRNLDISIQPTLPESVPDDYGVLIDAVFGFSFNGGLRSPFDTVLPQMNQLGLPIFSIDVPSGWDVEQGNVSNTGINHPSALISLTAPKLCARNLDPSVSHYLGGRFIPPSIAEKFQLNLPPYPGSVQFIKLSQ